MKMIKKVLHKFTDVKFIRFFVSGVTSFAVDTIILSVVTFTIFQGSNPLLFGSLSLPKLISSTFGLATNFVLNRNWVFKAKMNGSARSQALKFIIFSVLNVLFASIIYNIYLEITIFLSHQIGIDSETNLKLMVIFTNFITEGTKMVISFLGYKYFVFK